MKTTTKIAIIILALVIVVGFAVPLYQLNELRTKLTIQEVKVSGISQKGTIPLIGIPSTIEIGFDVIISNPTPYTLDLERMTYTVFLQGTQFTEGFKHDILIPPNSTTPVRIDIEIDLLKTASIVVDAVKRGVVEYKIVGVVDVPIKLFGFIKVFTLSLPYETGGTGSLGSLVSGEGFKPLYVVDAGWDSHQAYVGDSVKAYAVLKSDQLLTGTAMIVIKKDLALLPDAEVLRQTFPVSFPGERKLELSFMPAEASSISFRGYFIEVWYEGDKIYSMPDSYPPRLKVLGAQAAQGTITVLESYWVVAGQKVTVSELGSNVEAHVTLKAQNGPIAGELILKVKKDISYAPDTDYRQFSIDINLNSEESRDFFFTWSPDEASAGSLRGYFIEIWFNGQKIKTMDSSYPPRLKVTIRSQGSPQVIDYYWIVGGQKVTSCALGSRVEGHVIIKAVNGPLEGYLSMKIRKDIALLPDQDFVVDAISISVRSGETTDVYAIFYPSEASGLSLRGYFIEVDFTSWETKWTMNDSYPPRLKVTS